jgi:hypothetical protein
MNGFGSWMVKVNAFVEKLIGLSVDDLPDANFADWYEDGVKPLAAAKRAIKLAGE